MSILAYCLLPNHFHLVVKIKEQSPSTNSEASNDSGKQAVRQLMRLFITYAMSINNKENRVGNLFAPKYKRLQITSDEYLKYLIFYTHYNPEKHDLINSYALYTFSSFKALSSNKTTKVDRQLVYEIFDGRDNFMDYHRAIHKEQKNLELD